MGIRKGKTQKCTSNLNCMNKGMANFTVLITVLFRCKILCGVAIVGRQSTLLKPVQNFLNNALHAVREMDAEYILNGCCIHSSSSS